KPGPSLEKLSVSVGPVFSGMDFHRKATAKVRRSDHGILYDLPRYLQLVGCDLEYEFVVDGKQHTGKPLVGQSSVHVDHGLLDNVGGTSLDGRIERHALAQGPQPVVRRLEFRHVAAPAEHGCGEAVNLCLFDLGFKKKFYLGELRIISLDE